MPLTHEQQKVIDHTGNCIVNAIAGSGKTTTLIEYTKKIPKNKSILYIVFNASMKEEACKKFAESGLGHVAIETAHSLAYKHIIASSKYKVQHRDYTLEEIIHKCSLSKEKNPYIFARHIQTLLNYYCNSEYAHLSETDYTDMYRGTEDALFLEESMDTIVRGAERIYADMDEGRIAVTHDFYLKKFERQRNILPYEYILFDEAQDASGAMLGIVRTQEHATKIMVGDTHQQIYGWRYAVNSLEKVTYPIHHLSRSFRFPQHIADYAMRVLDLKRRLIASPTIPIKGMSTSTGNGLHGHIARSNQGLLELLLAHIEKPNPEMLYCEGGIDSYVFGGGGLIRDVLSLFQGKRVSKGPLSRMRSFEDFEHHAHRTRNIQWSLMIDMVKRYREDLPALIDSLHSYHGKRSEVTHIFSTVHKCKGMEYETVILASDFISPEAIIRASDESLTEHQKNRLIEEINILYVAITRAQQEIIFPEGMEWVNT